jgi:hypothetical protein
MARIELYSIEYNLTEHCNLRCHGCDHNSPLMPERYADLDEFRRDLSALAPALDLETINLIGGEPLLHPQLCDFIRAARDAGLARTVTVISNGVLLHKVEEAFWELTDRLMLTRYPGVRWRMTDEEIKDRCQRHGIELSIMHAPSFHMVLLNEVNRDEALVQEIYDACRIAHYWRCHSVHGGRFYKCSVAPFIPARLAMLGKPAPGWESDGIRIHDNPGLADELDAYLRSPAPLASCAACLGTSGSLKEHRQMNQAAGEAWLREDHSDVSALIDTSRLIRHRDRAHPGGEHVHQIEYDSTRSA